MNQQAFELGKSAYDQATVLAISQSDVAKEPYEVNVD